MFPSNKKKVHYERGTKGGKSSQGHRSSGSRDSGVGSESASDRAALGTSPGIDPQFSRLDLEDQRSRPWAIQEALDSANEKIRQLQAEKMDLDDQLAQANKENRALKRDRTDLLTKVDFLMEDLKNATKNSKSKQETSPRTGVPTPKTTERRTTLPRKEPKEAESRRYKDERTQDRRQSWRELPGPLYDGRPPAAPQPPPNTAPNPFMPNSARTPSVSAPYAASAVYATVTPSTVSYAPQMIYPTAPASIRSSTSHHSKEDGLYHSYPLR